MAINVLAKYSSNLDEWRRNVADKLNRLITYNNGVKSATAVTTSYTLGRNDTFLAVDAGVITITLADVDDVGRRVIIKDTGGNAGTSTITVAGTIDGVTNATITTNYGSLTLISDGVAWFSY